MFSVPPPFWFYFSILLFPFFFLSLLLTTSLSFTSMSKLNFSFSFCLFFSSINSSISFFIFLLLLTHCFCFFSQIFFVSLFQHFFLSLSFFLVFYTHLPLPVREGWEEWESVMQHLGFHSGPVKWRRQHRKRWSGWWWLYVRGRTFFTYIVHISGCVYVCISMNLFVVYVNCWDHKGFLTCICVHFYRGNIFSSIQFFMFNLLVHVVVWIHLCCVSVFACVWLRRA